VSSYLFEPPPPVSVEIAGRDARFPVNRIFCVGRNYAAHVREMGFDPDREAPCYFTKASCCIAPSGSTIPYPPATDDYHHEIELVAAIGKAGYELPEDEALSVVFGYACGLDMTRRDLQIASRESKGPWDIGKDFENAAVIGHIRPVADIGHPDRGRIELRVNGEQRQDSDLANLIWPVPAIVAHLSTYYRLEPGDLIYTGTPDGVGPVRPGDRITGSVEGVGEIELVCRPNEAQGQGR
jgi:fumarylpyruvate hydrolase